jgi:23S rRNA (uracil1939-C5)-methyltransferase
MLRGLELTLTMTSSSMTFELSPHKLVYGGAALGYAQGRTVLALRVLPGERAEVETVRMAKGVLHARPVRILCAAPERVAPPCPYFGACGGCHYQHLAVERQIRWKREILRETLRRIGKISWEGEIAVHQAEPWHYRNQAALKVGRDRSGGALLGFFESESHRVVPVESCAILSPRLNRTLDQLNEPVWRPHLGHYEGVQLLADDRDERVRIVLRGGGSASEAKALAEGLLAGIESAAGVVVETGSLRWVAGEAAMHYRVGEFQYRISPGAFFQASRFLVSELVTAVTAGVSGSAALDLYAGVGLFSLPLAKNFAEVQSVESQSAAARDLEWNAQTAGLNNVRSSNENVWDFLRRYARAGPELAVLDPPRAGAGQPVMECLAILGPRRIHYVSCHPPTGARDLGFLLARGYRLEAIEMFDFFPQTYHIEFVARLAR